MSDTSDSNEKRIALDRLGIPILDEVVILEEDYSIDDELTFDSIPEPRVEMLTEPYEPSLDPSLELPAESWIGQNSSLKPVTELDKSSTETAHETLREQIRLQVMQDLEEIADNLAHTIVANLSVELKQHIHTELKQALDSRMNEIISHTINDISKNNENF